MADKLAHQSNPRQVVTIDTLPDDVLLAIFDSYVVKYENLQLTDVVFNDGDTKKINSWQLLVHVCRRWRGLVFDSPRRLNLRLQLPGIPARKTLDVWPALPLLIHGHVSEAQVDNVIAELEHNDRICKINLNLDIRTTSQIETEKFWTAMQVPFPELEILFLDRSAGSYVPALPDSFLGGSAPRLRFLAFSHIPFRGLPSLLMTATHLVDLSLHDIPHSGYISPNTVVTCLSMLTNLERFQLYFESPQSSPDQETRFSPPPTRSILPALIRFSFKGVNEYFEELVARINTPRLELLSTTFFNDIDFDTQELTRFVSRSPTFETLNEAHFFFDGQIASVNLIPHAFDPICTSYFLVEISCREPVWQLSSLAQICTTFLPLLSMTESLSIYGPGDPQLIWKDSIENIEWLELLLPFTAVKNLYLAERFVPLIAPALQAITEGGATEVLSNLQNLYLEGFEPSKPLQEGIKRFISGRHVTLSPFLSGGGTRTSAGNSNG